MPDHRHRGTRVPTRGAARSGMAERGTHGVEARVSRGAGRADRPDGQ
jgi:hypothetical protein